MRELLEHRLNQFLIALVGRARLDHERDTLGVADNVAFAAIFTAIRGVRAGVVAAIQSSHRGAVDDHPIDVQFLRLGQRYQQEFVNFVPDTSLRPLMEATPTCAVADTEILGQQPPRDAAPEDIHDAFETLAVILARRSTFGRRWMLRQQWPRYRPELVRNKKGDQAALPVSKIPQSSISL